MGGEAEARGCCRTLCQGRFISGAGRILIFHRGHGAALQTFPVLQVFTSLGALVSQATSQSVTFPASFAAGVSRGPGSWG